MTASSEVWKLGVEESRVREGKGLAGGWFLLAKKLRALGVSTPALSKACPGVSTSVKGGCSFKGKEKGKGTFKGKEKGKGTYAEVTRVKIGEPGESLSVHLGDRELLCREEQLSRCLVGCFGDSFESVPPLSSLTGGSRRFKEREFLLQRWGLEVGCFWNGSHAKEVWVRVAGLPLHLWSRELQWARILVRASGKNMPGALQVVARHTCWVVRLWWETPPWVSQVVPRSAFHKRARREVGSNLKEEKCWTQEVERAGPWAQNPSALWEQAWAPLESIVGALGLEQVELADEDFNVGGSLPGRSTFTDEALMDEASSGLEGSTAGAMGWDPLRAVPTEDLLVLDGRKEPPRGSTGSVSATELAIVPIGSGYASPIVERIDFQLEEEGGRDEGWNSSCLAKFSRCLGMLTKEFEEEILYLLRRMEGRIDQKGQDGASRKTKLMSSKSSRELKKLEWTVSYKKASVYGPVYSTDREDFWDEFGSIRGLWSDPWCVGGDFNMIRFPEECGRGGGLSASMRRFLEVVEDLELRDFPLQGVLFTWRGGLNIQSHSRLDRFLVIDNWDNLFNGAVQGVLPRPIFDHFPILLEGGMKRGPFPFRFENTWLEEEGFKDQMKTWWGSLSFTRTSNFVLDAKLREDILKTWNKEVFGLIETKKGEALRQVLREEISWKQKSREVWLKEGDNNTIFFHRMANAHSRINWLFKLKVNGSWHTEENDLKDSVLAVRLRAGDSFLEEEVFATHSDLGKDTSLSLDGFTKVPKKGGAEDLKDFRLISLVGSLYKLLAKVLANRIKKVDNQSGEERVNPGGQGACYRGLGIGVGV
ncbi:hypothetical protein CK203_094920 [Vitis vinifera]|uniref:DUF4283 domain-containing protein n=1 Tax=Vitis vinifera TaxID=29760 RepID=A0A438DN94_VITVI|nr:hypothetical protein CK203_094920 [Vitis vinifera]